MRNLLRIDIRGLIAIDAAKWAAIITSLETTLVVLQILSVIVGIVASILLSYLSLIRIRNEKRTSRKA